MKVKQLLGTLVGAGLLISAQAITTQAIAADYIIDKKGQHAFITFKASHLGYSYNVGRFNDFDGKFSHDPDNPEDSKISVVINAASIDTNHAERDKHLRSADFLDVAKYPTITFTSTGYQAGADGDTLKGNLSMHGVTKEVSIATRQIGEGKDPWGGYRSGFEGYITIKASDFGMPDWVGDVSVELIIEGIRQ